MLYSYHCGKVYRQAWLMCSVFRLNIINLVFISLQSSLQCNATFSFIKGKDYRYHYVYISNDQIHSSCAGQTQG